MSPVTAQCPSCGAPIEFRYDDTFVRVCSYCNAVVARADRGLASLGRMGDLAVTESPLALFASGQLNGLGFQLVGRAQIAHSRGGSWEEWYARFDDGSWGWLAEAQGRFQLSFATPLPPGLPPFEHLAPGQPFPVPLALPGYPFEEFVVAEIGHAEYRAAAGELPYRLEPGQRFRYADLSGRQGGSATIDAGVDPGDPVALYVGREVSLAQLGIAPVRPGEGPSPPDPGRAAAKVSAHHVACVQCGGSLELRAPDAALRVTCPYCAAILDVNQGHLSYLRTLDKGTEVLSPDIPLGTTAELDGKTLTVIGCLQRSVQVDEVRYPFTEYLLYQPELGYRWLVESAGQWSYVTPIAAGAVDDGMAGVRYGNRRFRHFQTAIARVDRLFGEFTWRVEPGEKAEMADHVAPPFMLSSEVGQGEIQWSLGRWLSPEDLGKKLTAPGQEPGLGLPASSSIAPHQPYRHAGLFTRAALLVGILVVAGIVVAATSPDRPIEVAFGEPAAPPVDPAGAPLDPGASATVVQFSEPFELRGKNVEVRLDSALDNSWLFVSGDLVNDDTGLVTSFERALERYSGSEGGESWSEGSARETVHLPSVPAGRYVLRVEKQWAPGGSAPHLDVSVREGVFRGVHLMVALAALLAIPLLIGIHRFLFERRRWAESDHPWLQGSDG